MSNTYKTGQEVVKSGEYECAGCGDKRFFTGQKGDNHRFTPCRPSRNKKCPGTVWKLVYDGK